MRPWVMPAVVSAASMAQATDGPRTRGAPGEPHHGFGESDPPAYGEGEYGGGSRIAAPKTPASQTEKAFNLMAVGFLFLFDFHFNSDRYALTLTPDFVAFILFATALHKLRDVMQVGLTRSLAQGLAAATGIVFLFDLTGFAPSDLRVRVLYALWVPEAIVVWLICGQILQFAILRKSARIARMAESRRIIYLVMFIITVFYRLFFMPGRFVLIIDYRFVVNIDYLFVATFFVFAFGAVALLLLSHLALKAKALSRLPPRSPLPTLPSTGPS